MQDMTTDFVDEVERRLADLRREEVALAAQEEGVRRKRGEIRQRMNELEATIRVYREVMNQPAPPVTPTVGLFENVPMGTIGNMAFEIMQRVGQPMKVADVARALVAAGKLQSEAEGDRGNYGTVYGTLLRDRRFTKVGTGAFGLAATNGQQPIGLEPPASLYPDVPED